MFAGFFCVNWVVLLFPFVTCMKIAIIFSFLYSSRHYISTLQCMCLLVGIGEILAVLTKGKEKKIQFGVSFTVWAMVVTGSSGILLGLGWKSKTANET